MALKVITIDFWNTIFDSSNGTARNKYRIDEMKAEIAGLGVRINEDVFSRIMEESWQYFNNIWKKELRTPTIEESQNFFWSRLDLPESKIASERISKAFAESILFYPPKLIDGVVWALDSLSSDYTLAVVSDTGFSPGKVLRRLMQENDILQYFSAFSFSDETRVAKPHPTAFQTILEQFNIKPREAVHIGDIEDTDIKGAKDLGMMAIRYTGDPTAFLNLNNPKITAADYESDSWNSIVEYIKSVH